MVDGPHRTDAATARFARGLHRVEDVMGIPVGIDVRDDGIEPEALDRAFGWLRWVDATFSTYRAGSEVSRLNAGTLALGDAAPEVRAVLARCEALRERTRGCFDVRARGALDPSAFVKGWAIESVAAMLAGAGARNLCVHAGGDVRVRGERASGLPWRVGIQHPYLRHRTAAVLPARDLAVATSGAYERGAHIVDPRTGAPPEGVLSVTVLGPDLGTADAYATAAFAMGLEGPAWTAGLGDYEALTILSDGRVLSTRGVPDFEETSRAASMSSRSRDGLIGSNRTGGDDDRPEDRNPRGVAGGSR